MARMRESHLAGRLLPRTGTLRPMWTWPRSQLAALLLAQLSALLLARPYCWLSSRPCCSLGPTAGSALGPAARSADDPAVQRGPLHATTTTVDGGCACPNPLPQPLSSTLQHPPARTPTTRPQTPDTLHHPLHPTPAQLLVTQHLSAPTTLAAPFSQHHPRILKTPALRRA